MFGLFALSGMFFGPMIFLGVGASVLGANPLLAFSTSAILSWAGIIIGWSVLFSWAAIAMVEIIAHADEKLGMWQAIGKAFYKIPGLIGLGLVSGLITTGAYIPLLIPAIIVTVWFSFGWYVYITDGVGGLSALRISREYTRGKFWGVFGRQFFLFLLPLAWEIGLGIISAVVGEGIFRIIALPLVLTGIPIWMICLVYPYQLFRNLREIRGVIDQKEVQTGKTKWIILAIWGLAGWLLIPVGMMAIILLAINPAAKMQQARDADTRFRLHGMQNNLRHYQTINGEYPSSLDDLVPDVTNRLPDGKFEYRALNGGQEYVLCIKNESASGDCVSSAETNF
jgi:hypothetical protein